MKENDLFEIIGDIDDEKIERAYNAKSVNRNYLHLKRVAFAACFVLIAAVSFSVANEKGTPNPPVKETVMENYEKVSDETVSENLHQSAKTESNSPVLSDTNKTYEIKKNESLVQYDSAQETEEIAAEDAILEDDSDFEADSSVSAGLGGGGGSSGSSALRKEEFSLEYLNLLNEKITENISNEEFSFILSSFVNENTNKVEVLVNSMEQELIDRVTALDTQGGAIDFKLSSQTVDLQ